MIATVSFQYETNDYGIRVLNNESGTYEKLESKLLSDLSCEIHKLVKKGLKQIFVESGYNYIYDKMNVYLFDYGFHISKTGKIIAFSGKVKK